MACLCSRRRLKRPFRSLLSGRKPTRRERGKKSLKWLFCFPGREWKGVTLDNPVWGYTTETQAYVTPRRADLALLQRPEELIRTMVRQADEGAL